MINGAVNEVNAANQIILIVKPLDEMTQSFSGVRCQMIDVSNPVFGENRIDSYGIAKLSVEQELNVSRNMFGLKYIIYRPHNIYGERQNIGDPYRNVIGIFMNQIMQGRPLSIFGDGTQTRAFTYVKDIAPVIAKAHVTPKAYGHTFNIGADTPYDLNSLAKAVSNAMGTKAEIIHVAARKEVEHAYSSHEKVRA